MSHQLNKNSADSLRVAFPSFNRGVDYDPVAIHLSYEYIFLENIFSPLVEISPKDGDITEGVASKMSWRGDDLHLEIREDLKTISGRSITADDVVFSLKRLLILSGNTHGNFEDLVCPGFKLKSVEDECPGIKKNGNTVILSASKRKSFLLPMLGAIDFAVIPRHAVDPKTLKIIDYTETSGPYYVKTITPDGRIQLGANPNHYHYSKEIASNVELIPFDRSKPNAALSLLENKTVDHIMTTNSSPVEDLINYAQHHNDVTNLHVTMNIKNVLLVFTERGIKEISQAERENIARGIRSQFIEMYKSKPGYDPSYEFFSSLAEGGLTQIQQKNISDKYNTPTSPNPKKIDIALLKSGDVSLWENAVKNIVPNANCFKDVRIPDLSVYKNDEHIPHAFIAATDSSYFEDINLISYSLNAGYFGLSKPERKDWLAAYMSLEDKKERLSQLQDLHYKSINDAVLVPLVISPFVAVSNKKWNMQLSTLYANNQLWLVTRQ